MKTKDIIAVVVIIAIILAIIYIQSNKVAPELAAQGPVQLKEGKYPKAPELAGITGYLNTQPGIKIADFRGKVVLIDFWTYTCINCIRTLPFLVDWDKKYRDQGLVIIGVHTPEFEFEKDTANVKAALVKYGIKYAVVQDNNYETWNAFNNHYWPRKYLIDKDGYIRFDHVGEGGYDETEKKIQELLAETGHNVTSMNISHLPDLTPTAPITPELYAGYGYASQRGENIGNTEGLKQDQVVDYKLPSPLPENVINLEGKWKSNFGDLQAQGMSSIILGFTAKAVNIVVGPGSEGTRMEVFVDDKYVSKENAGTDVQFDGDKAFVSIKEPRLYNVVNNGYGNHVVRLSVDSTSFNFAAFTFG